MEFDIEDVLDRRLKLVNEWLQFAEKKNATLLVFNAGTIWGIGRLVNRSMLSTNDLSVLFYVGIAAVGASIFCCIVSFFPILKISVLNKQKEVCSSDNTLFFGDIAKYNPDDYLKLLLSSYGIKTPIMKYHLDYAGQLIINSKIAKTKYLIFNGALYLSTFGLTMLVLFNIGEKI